MGPVAEILKKIENSRFLDKNIYGKNGIKRNKERVIFSLSLHLCIGKI